MSRASRQTQNAKRSISQGKEKVKRRKQAPNTCRVTEKTISDVLSEVADMVATSKDTQKKWTWPDLNVSNIPYILEMASSRLSQILGTKVPDLEDSGVHRKRTLSTINEAIPDVVVEITNEVVKEKVETDKKESKSKTIEFASCGVDYEYFKEIENHLRESEKKHQPNPNYIQIQKAVTEKHRTVLFDWIFEVCKQFKLKTETFVLTVNIVDQYLSRDVLAKEKLQVLGVTACWVACKYNELQFPSLDEFVDISARSIEKEDMIKMEIIILQTLHFSLTVPLPTTFLEPWLFITGSSPVTSSLAYYFIHSFSVDIISLNFLPSLLAAVSLYLANSVQKNAPTWTSIFEETTGYSLQTISDCASKLYPGLLQISTDRPIYKHFAGNDHHQASLLSNPLPMVLG